MNHRNVLNTIAAASPPAPHSRLNKGGTPTRMGVLYQEAGI
jgi:hypothetical protein